MAIVQYYDNMKETKKRSALKRWNNLSLYITTNGLKPKFKHIKGEKNKLADILSRLIIFPIADKDFMDINCSYKSSITSPIKMSRSSSSPGGSIMAPRKWADYTSDFSEEFITVRKNKRPIQESDKKMPDNVQTRRPPLVINDKLSFQDFTGRSHEFNLMNTVSITHDQKIIIDNIFYAHKKADIKHQIAALNGLSIMFSRLGKIKEEKFYVIFDCNVRGIVKNWGEVSYYKGNKYQKYTSLEDAYNDAIEYIGPKFFCD